MHNILSDIKSIIPDELLKDIEISKGSNSVFVNVFYNTNMNIEFLGNGECIVNRNGVDWKYNVKVNIYNLINRYKDRENMKHCAMNYIAKLVL